MKYGQTLRQRSIPAWSAYNIDYDDIKHFIKERTTPGKGKTVAVPGRSDDKAESFEQDLYHILEEQHQRIDLFVKSKAREIQHRLDDAKKRLRHLATRSLPADQRIPISRLERYGKLENDVLKAGEEIKSLARFISTQRTAFRKLMKKYKKWTGSVQLEDRVRTEVLDDPKSFTKYDLGPLLDEYSGTLHDIRALYEARLQQAASNKPNARASTPNSESPTIARLQASLATGSRTDFDTTFETAPLGSAGTLASYFVHPDNIVELHVLLLQHLRYLSKFSSSLSSTPVAHSPHSDGHKTLQDRHRDHFVLAADSPDRFIQEQSALTVDEREHNAGSTVQRTKLCARWNNEEDAIAAAKIGATDVSTYSLKAKHVDAFFDKTSPFIPRRESMKGTETELSTVRDVLTGDEHVQSLYSMSSNRSRFVALGNSLSNLVLASLDSNISFDSANIKGGKSSFPFAVLQVRQEGNIDSSILNLLDNSHLTERVRGFSMEYHAVWHLYKPSTVAAPFWVTTLTRDIRKLPPATAKRSSNANTTGATSNPDSPPVATGSNGSSVMGTTDGTATAVESSRHPSLGFGDSETPAPPLRAFRNKRRREYPQAQPAQQQARYWSEYDHPEDGSDAGDAYVIYIDPNERSSFEVFFDKLAKVFSRRPKPEEEGLLSTPSSPRDDESSSDEDSQVNAARRPKSYGALPSYRAPPLQRSWSQTAQYNQQSSVIIPQFSAVSLVASLVILVVAYLLAATGRHKLATEVDAGVIFAIISSLIFAIVGVAALWREQNVAWLSWMVAGGTLVVDAVGSGGLLAWMLG
ncbi:hypothetical protein Q7P37_008966 [Cladosporium fusiforme]